MLIGYGGENCVDLDFTPLLLGELLSLTNL